MQKTTRYWQWPNLLALDAAVVAVGWQAAFATTLALPADWAASMVLGLSVWLTYLADRLMDVASRPQDSLLSLRHQYAKRHARTFWKIWCGVLTIDLILATQLSAIQLQRGTLLLVCCLLYTLLNQKLSRRFFPKELCVALIYAGGVVVFLPAMPPLDSVVYFAWLCLLNCLIIGAKEKSIDAKLQVHSLAPIIAERCLGALAIASALTMFWVGGILSLSLALSFGLLGVLQLMHKKIEIETFRVLADGLLLVGPFCLLLHQCSSHL